MKIQLLLTAILLPALALTGCATPPTTSTSTDTVQSVQPSTPPRPAATPPPKGVAPRAWDVLTQMAAYLRSLDHFKVRVEKTTELILPTEQRLHADQTMEIALQKPDRLRVDYQNLSGGHRLFYDGKDFSLYTPEPNVYATATAPPTLDATLDLLADRYHISMPIADLLVADPQSRLVQHLQSGVYVGQILVRGVPCHHLAFRTPEVDWEIWVEEGPKPLPRRLLLADKSVKGSPWMVAFIGDWDLAPQFPVGFFTFEPPQNAQKIAFLADLPTTQPVKAAK